MRAFIHQLRIRHRWHWLVGGFAFLWIILRTGTNPKRLTYPCQQAAMPLAISWLLSIVAFFVGSVLVRKFLKVSALVGLVGGLVWFIVSLPNAGRAVTTSSVSLPVWEVSSPVSTVFVLDSIPRTTGSLASGDSTVPTAYLRDPAIDTLLEMMAIKGIYLHQTPSHPNGIIHSNDVVVIKGNYQWKGRNTTSNDRMKGLIWQILSHPSGFTGEIIVCDNTQATGINEQKNNSEDTSQSIIDVVNTFHAKGYPVYLLDWGGYWENVVDEYANGNYTDGYPYDSVSKISYPKFRTPSHQYYISLRYGLWDSLAATYDPTRLCIIDVPVLKAHRLAGATVAVKNWIGVLTTAYNAQRYGGWVPMHDNYFFSDYALVARVMAVTFPRLSIVDAEWTTTEGPNNDTAVVQTKTLFGSTDPVAVSWYAAKFLLTSIALHPEESNPDLPTSKYHNFLTRWTTFLHDSAGFNCTKDSSEISVYGREVLNPLPIQLASFVGQVIDGNTIQLEWSTLSEMNNYGFFVERRREEISQFLTVSELIPGAGTTLETQHYQWSDVRNDAGTYTYRLRQIDLDGIAQYSYEINVTVKNVLDIKREGDIPKRFALYQNFPNPFNPRTIIEYDIPKTTHVSLKVFDVSGREVMTMIDHIEGPAHKSLAFDGADLPSGLYLYRIKTDSYSDCKRMLLIK